MALLGKLNNASTCRNFRQVRVEDSRQAAREVPHYNLDMMGCFNLIFYDVVYRHNTLLKKAPWNDDIFQHPTPKSTEEMYQQNASNKEKTSSEKFQ